MFNKDILYFISILSKVFHNIYWIHPISDRAMNILNSSYYTERFIQIFRLIHIFKNKITYLCAFDRAIVLRSFTSYSVVFYGVCYFRRIMSRQLSLTSSLQRKDILAQSFFKVVKLSFWFFSKFNFRFLKLSQAQLAFFMMKRDFGLVYVGKTLSIFQYYDCMLNCTINGKFDRGIMYVSNGNP